MKVVAQPKAKDFLLEGSGMGSKAEYFYADSNSFSSRKIIVASFYPQIGIFIFQRLAIGGSFGITYLSTSEYQPIDDTASKIKGITTKLRSILVSFGGFASYYYPIKEKLFWINTFTYQRGSKSDGISFASFISEKNNTFSKTGFTRYNLISGIQYFIKSNLSLTANVRVFSFQIWNKNPSFKILDKNNYLSIGLNYLLIAEDE